LIKVAFKATITLRVAIKQHWQVLRVLHHKRRRNIKPHTSCKSFGKRPRLHNFL